MWHWNSLWARAPGDPPTLVDPELWQKPWTAEQAATLQARSLEALLTAGQSWWGYMFSLWPAPTWPSIGQLTPPTGTTTAQPVEPEPRHRQPSTHEAPASDRKRVARPAARHAQEARKR